MVIKFDILLCRQLPDSCQKVLFSATYSDEVISFANRVVPDAVTIKLKRSEESLENIKQVTCYLLWLYHVVESFECVLCNCYCCGNILPLSLSFSSCCLCSFMCSAKTRKIS